MKAILVIDMPKSCAECTLRTSLEANYLYCIATLPRLKIDPMTANHIKEHKCPLKPMPEIKTDEAIKLANMINSKATFQEFADGWNACLKEIQKC